MAAYERRPLLERALATLAEPNANGCRLSSAYPDRQGYPQIHNAPGARPRKVYVHRVICEAAHGPALADKPLALHHCDVPACGEAARLYWGDHADNVNDRWHRNRSRGRQLGAIAPGERLAAQKITFEIAEQIRREYAAGAFQNELAAHYGITQSQVSLIVRGKRWLTAQPLNQYRR